MEEKYKKFNIVLNKRFKNLIPITLVAMIVSGCFSVDDEEEYKGSIIAVSACIEKNEIQAELLSRKLIKLISIKGNLKKFWNEV